MVLETKRFQILNDSFICRNCGRDVAPTAQTTPRDHCPFCLWGLHADINPGDRANRCRGKLKPIGINTHTKKEYIIIYDCERCGERVRAKAILSDENGADDMDAIIELSSKPIRVK